MDAKAYPMADMWRSEIQVGTLKVGDDCPEKITCRFPRADSSNMVI
jgi:hypothetical protein